MLRITVIDDALLPTIRLEGRLAGDWVHLLDECWRRMLAGAENRGVRVDLQGVSFVDDSGKQLLAAMHRQGAVLLAAGCVMKAMVFEITRSSGSAARKRND